MIIETYHNAPYREILARQRQLFDALVDKKRCDRPVSADDEHLLLVEHTPVYTLGRHGNPGNMLHHAGSRYRDTELVAIERGGDITFHGPGQLVAYPIIDLQRRGLGVKRYVELLEEAVIRTIAHYSLAGERHQGAPGVWLGTGTPDERKICAIGIKCRRFVTMHGVALNVNTDLSWFSAINPCGFIDKGVTSIAAELGCEVSYDEVEQILGRNLILLLKE